MTYLLLFYEFFKTGLFAVGGGLATLPFLYDMAARHPEWFTTSQLADMVAVSESTPGPLGVNMATYVGFITGGIPGALVSTIGLVAPSIIIILIVAAFLKRFRDSKLVNAVFYGLRPASTAMVSSAGVSVAALALVNTGAVGLALVNWKGSGPFGSLHLDPVLSLPDSLYVHDYFDLRFNGLFFLNLVTFYYFSAVMSRYIFNYLRNNLRNQFLLY